MIWPLDVSAMLLPFVTEALHQMGLWASVPMMALLAGYEVHRKFVARETEIAALRRQVAELQEKRLQDAREMIRIAEANTEATASQTKSDERFADILEAVLRSQTRPGLFGWRR